MSRGLSPAQSLPGLSPGISVVFRTEAHGAVVCMDIFFRTLGAVVSRTGIFVAMLSVRPAMGVVF